MKNLIMVQMMNYSYETLYIRYHILYNMRRADRMALLSLLFAMGLSTIYMIYRWPYTPETVMDDVAMLGPYGFLIDIIFIGGFVIWYRNRKK